MRTLNQLAVGILLSCGLYACAGNATTVPLPAVLIGRWETTTPAYADRYFELTSTNIIIGTGAGTYERSTITTVRQTVDDTGVLYTVQYVNQSGNTNSVTFYFDGHEGGAIRLRNQRDIVWRKVGR